MSKRQRKVCGTAEELAEMAAGKTGPVIPTESEIQAAIENTATIKDPLLRRAWRELVEEGLIVDSGHRRGGLIAWTTVKNARRH